MPQFSYGCTQRKIENLSYTRRSQSKWTHKMLTKKIRLIFLSLVLLLHSTVLVWPFCSGGEPPSLYKYLEHMATTVNFSLNRWLAIHALICAHCIVVIQAATRSHTTLHHTVMNSTSSLSTLIYAVSRKYALVYSSRLCYVHLNRISSSFTMHKIGKIVIDAYIYCAVSVFDYFVSSFLLLSFWVIGVLVARPLVSA